MVNAKLIFAVVEREKSEAYLNFFRKHGIYSEVHRYCNGTAPNGVKDLIGMKSLKKTIFMCMVCDNEVNDIKQAFLRETDLRNAGAGIAFFVPVDGIGGESAKNRLLGKKTVRAKEDEMKSKFALIITITDKGYVDKVMNAARKAGASGGTVVHAYGTGNGIAKFFGVTLSEEKEMIYVVVPREKRDEVMQSIMDEAGVKSEAHGITFALPVDSVLGIKAFEEYK